MSIPEKEIKKYNTLIYKLFDIVLNLSEKQQQILLKYAEELFLQEKRDHIRKAVRIPVYYATYDRVYSNYIKNISQNGLFIETQRPLFVGEEILMTFRLEGFDKPLKIKGEGIQKRQPVFDADYRTSDRSNGRINPCSSLSTMKRFRAQCNRHGAWGSQIRNAEYG
jgi:hypothetical protein